MIIGQYEFKGPFNRTSDLQDASGVYVVLRNRDREVYEVLAVDYCDKSFRNKLIQNTDHELWIRLCTIKLQVAALYAAADTGELDRIKIAVQREIQLI